MNEHAHRFSGNDIHETAVISGDVSMGHGNVIKAYTVIEGPVTIGDDNEFGPHAVIGTPAQDRNLQRDDHDAPIFIGSRNIIREFTAIQKPAYTTETRLGNDIYLMQSVHIPHDAQLEDGVTITPMVALAGITTVMQGTNIGMGSSVHQKSVIGPYVMIATGSAIVKNIRPFTKFIPGKPLGVNVHALKRLGLGDLESECEKYVRTGALPSNDHLTSLVKKFEQLHEESGRSLYS